ncbi:MAG TPA: hypothetical protein DDW52_03050 [Planctomycetaceae bacterium]|nr:hypothetical protein [Planctomycetaceae bacterium]
MADGEQDAVFEFDRLIGFWKGTCRTWFEPEKLADTSNIEGRFEHVINDKFVRHRYTGSLKGKERSGEETLMLNRITGKYEVAWMDSFHMNYAIMISTGEGTERGFSVLGEYDVGGGQPRWGWRTEYVLRSDRRLVIQSYNRTPEGEEALAIEIDYARAE